MNGGAFIFNKEFSATNNTAFNSGNFNFKGASSFNGTNFNNTGKITIEKETSFNNTAFNTSINTSNMTITGSVTLSGKNDLKNGSTLDFGSSQVTLTQGTTFNLTS
ncbi:hypothetical protein HpBT117_12840 [Helicobacter pylori]